MDLMCKFDGHMLYCNLEFWLNCLGSSLSLLEFHEDPKLKECRHVKKFGENYHCIAKIDVIVWLYIVNDWLWNRVFLLVLSQKSLEPGCIMKEKKKRKRDYEVDLQCLEILKFSLFYEVIVDRWMYDCDYSNFNSGDGRIVLIMIKLKFETSIMLRSKTNSRELILSMFLYSCQILKWIHVNCSKVIHHLFGIMPMIFCFISNSPFSNRNNVI